MGHETLTVTDNRTGQSYEIPIREGAIRATDLRQIRTGLEDVGLLSYDPAFMNTASTRSTITYIDGDRGILWYRGYPIEELAEHSSFLEVAYLLVHGVCPRPGRSRTGRGRSRTTPGCTKTSRGSWTASTTTPIP